ncbi:Protein of unknown function (DUF2809) [Abditibacterium utsteinense]|uniref:DUF2809 domain-containing protein n=1 Tax=Abditibacterium utsteinense TaxID=1960156 RepID=A0A2S8SNM6_9BACT|nr:DUF2809 domain-containing protein [Abditibacterium utsteinense]PQV62389.1 Protein of unknown function (DUF2809) [Abditibacterium utsteinense]
MKSYNKKHLRGRFAFRTILEWKKDFAKIENQALKAAKMQSFLAGFTLSRARNRRVLSGIASLVLFVGWNSRIYKHLLPSFIGDYAPDTLWALLVFLVVLSLWPQLSMRRATWIALLISYSIECSQLVQTQWLQNIRNAKVGGLLLGHGFLWSDMLCYTVGIAMGALIDAYFTTAIWNLANKSKWVLIRF